jgi:predicted acetyltransferase
MSMNLHWVSEGERERVGNVRGLCYGRSRKEIAGFVEQIRNDRVTTAGDWLVAERDGADVGTATAIRQTMWVRGGAVACQGVASVGTVKTSRRKVGDEPGVGTALMREVIRRGRENGAVVSALMPFRGSYYDHFGYGVAERRVDWTVPLSVMPGGEFESVRFYEARDREALEQCRQRVAQRGQADIERPAAAWDAYLASAENGFMVVDEGPAPEGAGLAIRGWMGFEHVHHAGADTVKCGFDTGYEDIATLKRFLSFLGSLRDQYSFATIQLPRDLPMNLLLKETQMTHRASRNHPTPEARPFTRMQVRVLDHVKLLDAMKLPSECSGKVNVAIRETEGHVTKLAIEMADGKGSAKPTVASSDLEMSDRVWAMVALGDLSATRAAELGLVSVTNRTPLAVLDALAIGPPPYCREYF